MDFTFQEATESNEFGFDEAVEPDRSRNVGSAARRQKLLEEQEAARREGERADVAADIFKAGENLIEPFTGRGILNQPARIIGAAGGVSVEDPFKGPIVHFPRPEGTSALAGVGQLASDFATGLTDPNMLVALPAAANPLGAALLGADVTRHIPEQVENAATVLGDIKSTPAAKVVAVGEPLIAAGMGATIGRSARPELPRYISVADQIKAGDLMSSEQAAANRAAVNLASPGTVRAAERMEVGPPSVEFEAPFNAGEVPFDRMQRFGGMELPPVEILPQSGRLPPVEILSEPRTLLERETRGKASFGASAPTLLRNAQELPSALVEATQRAADMGLTKSAEAAEQIARGPNVQEPYRAPVEFTAERAAAQERKAARASVEEGLTMENPPMEPLPPDVAQFPEPPGMPSGTLSRLQSSRIQAGKENVRSNVRNNPPAKTGAEKETPSAHTYESTDAAWRRGFENRSPEGIAKLEAELLGIGEQLKTNKSDALLRQKQFAREALDVAKGDTENALANEWIKKNLEPDLDADIATEQSITKAMREEMQKPGFDPMAENPRLLELGQQMQDIKARYQGRKPSDVAKEKVSVQSIVDLPANAGTKAAQDLGGKLAKDQIPALREAVKKANDESNTAIAKADADATPENLVAMSEAGTKAQLVTEALEAALDMQPGGKFDKANLTPAETAARLAGDDVVSKLESMKFTDRGEGKLFSLPHPDAIKAIGKGVWNDALDLAIVAVKAGRAIGEAIDAAIQHITKNVREFDRELVRANLEYVVHNETKAVQTATTPPATATKAPVGATKGAPPATTPPTPTPAPTPAPPGAPAPAPGARVTLDDVYKRFELDPKKGPSIGQRISQAMEAFRTGFSSRFRPLNKLAEDIAKQYGGSPRDVAGIFEQLKGSSGKAEADVYRFDKEVSDVVKGDERDFNAYMFLRRSIDRLAQDTATGETRRGVATYNAPDLQAKLSQLEANLGPDKVAKFQKAADSYQAHLDQALQQQVTSGRMSVEVYEAIKDGNQFYAPFKVMKWIEETSRPEGSGRRIDTMADYTKAMEGIEDPDFKLGDMLSAGRQNIAMSRILSEKNLAMQNLSELAGFDTNGDFIRRLSSGQDVPRGMEAVNVLENGQQVRYAVDPSVAEAVQIYGPQSGALVARISSGMFRAGATTFNLPFQVSNLLADVPRQAFVSKYGINAVSDLVRYPMDLIHSLYSSIAGNVFGAKNKLFMDYLDSGAAGTTVQQYLTPDALEFRAGDKSWFENSLKTVGSFADAIEQTSKILGVKRAMRDENIGTGKSLARFVPEAVTEIRRFSGSPDFGRMGKWTDQYRLNLLYMFLNARIQGTIADVGRLTGRDGASTAAKTWGKVGLSVGIPTAYLYWLNNSDEYREDYAKRPEQEKRNYWLIPKDKFITTSDGEKMRDYWRIPKREVAKWTANTLESGLDFARERDPEGLAKWGTTMAEELIPVNVQGNSLQERAESVASGLNPLLKAPLEFGSGRDMYRHKAIVPDRMKKASPEQQFTDRTSEVFKVLADKMPDVAPEVFRSPLMLENMTKNLTAGLLTQFLPRKPVEGRTDVENQPLLQRFQAMPYTDSTEFDKKMQGFEREAADDQLNRYRSAQKIFDANKGAKPDVLVKKVIAEFGRDEKLAERVIDLYIADKNGITPQERRILALPVEQRASFIKKELEGKDAAAKTAIIRSYAAKRILTTGVAQAMAK